MSDHEPNGELIHWSLAHGGIFSRTYGLSDTARKPVGSVTTRGRFERLESVSTPSGRYRCVRVFFRGVSVRDVDSGTTVGSVEQRRIIIEGQQPLHSVVNRSQRSSLLLAPGWTVARASFVPPRLFQPRFQAGEVVLEKIDPPVDRILVAALALWILSNALIPRRVSA
jgi:hypothetical protein